MARAISVHHGSFGRASLYALDRPLIKHAHREGHLVFFLGGAEANVRVNEEIVALSATQGVAISPWEPHSFEQAPGVGHTYVLTLYIKPIWFLENNQSAEFALSFGAPVIHVTPSIERWIGRLSALLLDDRPSELFDGFLFKITRQCFDQSWEGSSTGPIFHNVRRKFNDYRVRRTLRLMQDTLADEMSMGEMAREVGLSRPHFFKLFKMQMGLPPNLYLNTLRAEHAIEGLISTNRSVTDIALDLGFASQASFTRFFTSNVGIPPRDYRRVANFV